MSFPKHRYFQPKIKICKQNYLKISEVFNNSTVFVNSLSNVGTRPRLLPDMDVKSPKRETDPHTLLSALQDERQRTEEAIDKIRKSSTIIMVLLKELEATTERLSAITESYELLLGKSQSRYSKREKGVKNTKFE
jgi:hypothetical protein